MSDTLVSDLRKKFSEQQAIGPKPFTSPKPYTTPKPKPIGNGTKNNNVDNNPVNSNPPRPAKPSKPSVTARPKDLVTPAKFGAQPNISEGIKAVQLRRAPPPKAPVPRTTTPSEDTELSRILQKRNSKKVGGIDKENKDDTIGFSSGKKRSDSSSSANSIASNASSIVSALGGKPQKVELPSVRECGHRPPKRAKPPLVRLPKATPPKPKPSVIRPPTTKPKPERQVSLIQPTSDSEEEDQPLYDDTEATPTPVPRFKKIVVEDEESAPLSNMPNYQSTPQVTNSNDFGDTYDMVGDTGEDIYEAVDSSDIMEGRLPPGESNVPQESQEDEKAKEKQRKELEKQKKKEEEQKKREEEKREKERLKKERDEKKKKEKEEKENRKKFNIKGEITVLREMVSTEAYTAVDKLDIGCYSGEPLDLIRTDNNPQDRWLVRNKQGVYGYVKIYCVDNAEAQEFYDDVVVHEEEGEDEEVYDTCS